MTMKSMILFMINYHKPEVKPEIYRAMLLCVDFMHTWVPGYGKVSVR